MGLHYHTGVARRGSEGGTAQRGVGVGLGRAKGGITEVGWVDQIGGEGEASGRGVSGGDGTGVRCGSAGVEYPKDYGWLNVTKSLTGSEPPRSSPPRSQQRCTLVFRVGDGGTWLLVRLIKPRQKVLNLQQSRDMGRIHTACPDLS